MNDMSNKPQGGTKLDGLTIITNFSTQANDAPQARTPSAPLLGKLPPHGGYWQDPETGTEYSGGMEIAPTKGLG